MSITQVSVIIIVADYRLLHGALKRGQGLPVRDEAREAELLAERIAPLDVAEYYVSTMGRAAETARKTGGARHVLPRGKNCGLTDGV